MTSFVKTNNGLKEVGRSKIRNYESVSDVCRAIQAGCLTVGDLFTTIAAYGITEDLEAVVNCLVSITPNNASPSNMLVTQEQISAMNIGDLCARVCTNEANISQLQTDLTANTNLTNQIGTRVGVAEGNIATNTAAINVRVLCSDFTSYQSNVTSCIDSVETDISTRTTNLQTQITTNATDIATANSDISQLQSDLSDTNSEVSSIDSALTTTANRVANLSNCAGLDCTGTLTEADLDGLTCCKGTVTKITNSTTGASYTPDNTGNVTMRIATYSLSGSSLSITY